MGTCFSFLAGTASPGGEWGPRILALEIARAAALEDLSNRVQAVSDQQAGLRQVQDDMIKSFRGHFDIVKENIADLDIQVQMLHQGVGALLDNSLPPPPQPPPGGQSQGPGAQSAPRASPAAGGDRAEARATKTGFQERKGSRRGRGRAPATCPPARAEGDLSTPWRVVVAADLSRVPPRTWRRLQTLLRASYSCSVERHPARARGAPAWGLTVRGLVAVQAVEVALEELCEARCMRPEDVCAPPWPVARGARPHFQGWRLVHPAVTAEPATAPPGSPSSSASEVVLWP